MNNGKSNSKNNSSNRGNKGNQKTSGNAGKKSFSKNAGSNNAAQKSYGRGGGKFFENKPKTKREPQESVSGEMRLNKYISNSGVCSRREADIYIVSGNVKVNGEVITELGYRVKPDDVVNFDGSVITPEKKVYVLLNKPKGFATINEPIVSAENVLSLVKSAHNKTLIPVGRMDKTTIGLMLFTNDMNLVQKLNSPEEKVSKLYQVSLDRNLKYTDIEKIKNGLLIDEHKVFVEEIEYVDGQPKTEIGIKLRASNVKIVRALFEKLEYNVIKLDRVMYGSLTKWNLPRGKWRFLTEDEIGSLKRG
jgi:23S rRNA pseudouridine2605 synthase